MICTVLIALALAITAGCEPDDGGFLPPVVAEPPRYDIPAGLTLLETVRPPAGYAFRGSPVYHEGRVFVVASKDGPGDDEPVIHVYDESLTLTDTLALPPDHLFALTDALQLHGDYLAVVGLAGIRVYDVAPGRSPMLLWANREIVENNEGRYVVSSDTVYASPRGRGLMAYGLADGGSREVLPRADTACYGAVEPTNLTFDSLAQVLYFVKGGWCQERRRGIANMYAYSLMSSRMLWTLSHESWATASGGVSSGAAPMAQTDTLLLARNGREVVAVRKRDGTVAYKVSSMGGEPMDLSMGITHPSMEGLLFVANNGGGAAGVIEVANGREVWADTDLTQRIHRVEPYQSDFIYTSSGGARVYRLSARTGAIKWVLRSPVRDREDVLVHAPAIAGDELYFSDAVQLYRLRMEN